ncbi:MAG: beta-ketoacyl-ACP synthase II [Actinobacteria bacterium]|nr:beta-ketoacyl-ACP synthase II [Actinomycetota bacterium]
MSRRRVVITGLGAITSLGDNTKSLWDGLCTGASGIVPIGRFDASKFSCHIGGELTNFDPTAYMGTKQAKRIDRVTQFALIAAREAVNDSGLDFSKMDPFRAGVIIGSGIGGLEELETQHRRLIELGPKRVSPFTVPRLMVNASAGNVSIEYKIKGPNSATATACASGANAMGDAFRIIQRDEAEVMITGGAEAALTVIGLASFCALKAVSRRNDEPTKASRPFDLNRDGFVLSEGSGIVVFEELQHAINRDAKIYAEVLGYGMSGDGYHITAPDPAGAGACKAMQLALAEAKLNPEQVDYINAHGTATPAGDVAETRAIKSVFGESAYKVAVSSTKSQLGHLLGASGGVEMVAVCLAIENGLIPPTINLETPDPQCDLDYTPLTARQTKVDVAMSNSFGFGGHNASLVVKSYSG